MHDFHCIQEDELKALQIRNAEAERLFKMLAEQLQSKLDGTAKRLADLDKEHKDLKDSSTQTLQEMATRIQQLQAECEDLQARGFPPVIRAPISPSQHLHLLSAHSTSGRCSSTSSRMQR